MAAEELNFTRAAEKCGVSQPSLTRAIGLLESEMGGDLFRRERNLTHLTDLGKRMRPLLTKTIENADDALRLATSIQSNQAATLDLALPHGVPLEPFVPHLLELTKTFPDSDFKVHRGPWQELLETLKAGELDIVLSGRPEGAWDRFEFWPLYQIQFELVFSSASRLSGHQAICAEDLTGCSLLHRPYCMMSSAIRDHLVDASVQFKPAPTFAGDDDLLAYLVSSGSIAYLPTNGHLRDGLVRRRLSGPDSDGYEMNAVTVAGRKRSAAAALLLTQLRASDWSAISAA